VTKASVDAFQRAHSKFTLFAPGLPICLTRYILKSDVEGDTTLNFPVGLTRLM